MAEAPENFNRVSIVIGDEEDESTGRIGDFFGFWSDVGIKRSIDTYSSVSFSAPFEPDRSEFRETFRPFSFKRLECLINLEPRFTGMIVNVDPPLKPDERRVTVTGYSRPAVYTDVTAPVGSKLEFLGLTLRQIAEQIGVPFGVLVEVIGDDTGTPFKKVRLDIDKKIQEFFADLAKQRNLVISDTWDGRQLFWRAIDPGRPRARFEEGKAPLTKVTPKFSPQDYYSDVTGYGKRKRGYGPGKWTAHNNWLDTKRRPLTFKLEDSERADVPEATLARLGRMFANMASWTIEDLPGWRDQYGEIWEPNTTITLKAPSAMIYRETELLIRDVELNQNSQTESATLEVVLPGSFNGKVPEFLPWDEAA